MGVLTTVKGNMIEDGTITDSNFTNTTITSADMALDPRDADNYTSGTVPLAQLGNIPATDLTPLDDDGNEIPNDQRMSYQHLIIHGGVAVKPTEQEVNDRTYADH